jgi:uncharacterized protein YggE
MMMKTILRGPLVIGLTCAAGILALGSGCTETTVMPPQDVPGVSVGGQGSAFGEPDIALLSLGVSAEADSVGEARTQAADSMNAMLDSLKAGGVAEEDIQTTRFTVEPVYDYPLNAPPELRGFVVNNVVTAKIRSIDDTGTLIDGALEAGGNNARIDSLQFTIDDPTPLEDEARRMAVAEARAKAETLADEAGAALGKVRTLSEGAQVMPIDFDEQALAADFAQEAEDSTPISLGELEVVVNVQVVYELG